MDSIINIRSGKVFTSIPFTCKRWHRLYSLYNQGLRLCQYLPSQTCCDGVVCSSAIRDSYAGDRSCITAVPFSFGVFSLIQPRFLVHLTMAFLVWCGLVWVGLGFLWVLFFLRVNVSKMWMHQTPCTYIPVEK